MFLTTAIFFRSPAVVCLLWCVFASHNVLERYASSSCLYSRFFFGRRLYSRVYWSHPIDKSFTAHTTMPSPRLTLFDWLKFRMREMETECFGGNLLISPIDKDKFLPKEIRFGSSEALNFVFFYFFYPFEYGLFMMSADEYEPKTWLIIIPNNFANKIFHRIQLMAVFWSEMHSLISSELCVYLIHSFEPYHNYRFYLVAIFSSRFRCCFNKNECIFIWPRIGCFVRAFLFNQ